VLPADPRNFLLSFLSHAALVAFIASGIWVGHVTVVKNRTLISDLTYTPLPVGDLAPHGGGGGGDHSATQASRGTPPKFSDQQLAPPAIVVRSETPKLQAAPNVLGPPDLKLPQSNQIGDLFSPSIMPSNGTGSRGGIGSNSGTGIGRGDGAGVGPGSLAGYGDGVYRPGNGVSAPHALYDPDPEYSDEARRAKYQGNVLLSLVVDATGHVRDIHVARSVGMGLDENAIEAVQKWKFAPGMKDGRPVAVQVSVEVNFRLY
jgi:TonB family protein